MRPTLQAVSGQWCICCEIRSTMHGHVFLTPLLSFSSHHQAVQEKGVGESDRALRVQRICLSDGDHHPGQTAQVHYWRSEDLILSFMYLLMWFILLFSEYK